MTGGNVGAVPRRAAPGRRAFGSCNPASQPAPTRPFASGCPANRSPPTARHRAGRRRSRSSPRSPPSPPAPNRARRGGGRSFRSRRRPRRSLSRGGGRASGRGSSPRRRRCRSRAPRPGRDRRSPAAWRSARCRPGRGGAVARLGSTKTQEASGDPNPEGILSVCVRWRINWHREEVLTVPNIVLVLDRANMVQMTSQPMHTKRTGLAFVVGLLGEF
jgi:hypothetical protein